MGKKPPPPPEFREESRICGVIFICQLVAVLSAVSLVYLSVASYIPSIRAIASSYEENAVMCTTVFADDSVENCTAFTCFEWCLSKPSGLGMQIHVAVRNNGSELAFQQCENRVEKMCSTQDLPTSTRHICRKDQCETLAGFFNCTKGVCVNVTSAQSCNTFRSVGGEMRCKRRENCIALEGFFTCVNGSCFQVASPFVCERRCTDLNVPANSTVIFNGDRIIISQCEKVVETGSEAPIWDPKNTPRESLFIWCTSVRNSSDGDGLVGSDCVNATLVRGDNKASDKMIVNLSTLLTLSSNPVTSRRLPHNAGNLVPVESELMIYNRSLLKVNIEGCVNTLRDECKEFFASHGIDGRDLRAPVKFPCYYTPDNNETVVTRFSRNGAIFEFALLAAVPGGLLVLSCSCLILCTKIVGMGPDSHLTIIGCHSPVTEESAESNTAQSELLPASESNRNGTKNSDLNHSKHLSK